MKKTILLLACVGFWSTNVLAATLKELAEAKNKFIGTAVNNQYLEGNHNSNPTGYATALETEFNCVVAENAFKMGYLLPTKPSDPFNFTIADFDATGLQRVDALLDLAAEKGMRVRGHAFVWHTQAPEWLKNEAPNWTDQQIFDFTEQYITALGTYTKGKVDEWDVVNEAINDDATPNFRSTDAWYRGVSSMEDFLDHCFNVAKTVDPAADMFYNDYSIETKYNKKNEFMLSLVKGMTERNVKIDGVGFQSHFVSGTDMNTYFINEIGVSIDKLKDLGLQVAITELDLRICGGTTTEALTKQGEEFKAITELFLKKDNCKSLLVWGISDNGSWIPDVFDGCDDALLYDKNMRIKPAYNGIAEALGGEIIIVEPGVLAPYLGKRMTIPGKIELENYDLGGNGTAYSDNTSGNEGGSYREDDVDVAGTGDMGGGSVIGWAETGEYLKYSVNITKTGLYDFVFRVATPIGGGDFDILMNDTKIIENVKIDSTGPEWESYIDVSVQDISLTAGNAVLTVKYSNGGFNFNYIDIIENALLNNVKPTENNNLKAYPNPTQGLLNLSEPCHWVINTITGEKIMEGNGNKIDLQNQGNGLYLLQAEEIIYKDLIIKE